MNWDSIVIGVGSAILVGGIGSAIAGFLGVRFGLERFRTERAFDRRLEWHEKTISAVTQFGLHNATIAFALENNRTDLLKDAAAAAERSVTEFQGAVSNSLLYSDRQRYLRLKEISRELQQNTTATDEAIRRGENATELYRRNELLLEEMLFELSMPLRDMMRLDRLTLADFRR